VTTYAIRGPSALSSKATETLQLKQRW